MRILPIAIVSVAAALAGCGASDDPKPPRVDAPAAQARTEPQPLIVFRRVRYEGATLRTLKLYENGAVDIDIPNGGAGWSDYTGSLRPAALQRIRRTIEGTPWHSLSKRKVTYDRSGAYFMMRRGGDDYVAMADRMSKDLVPVIRSLNGVLDGGYTGKQEGHRFAMP